MCQHLLVRALTLRARLPHLRRLRRGRAGARTKFFRFYKNYMYFMRFNSGMREPSKQPNKQFHRMRAGLVLIIVPVFLTIHSIVFNHSIGPNIQYSRFRFRDQFRKSNFFSDDKPYGIQPTIHLKDVMFAMAHAIHEEHLAIFLKSVREHSSCDIVLFAQYVSAKLTDLAKATQSSIFLYNVDTLEPADWRDSAVCQPSDYRWQLVHSFLEVNPHYRYAAVSEVEGIAYLADPFRYVNASKLTVITFKKIKHHPSLWSRLHEIVGKKVNSELPGKPYIRQTLFAGGSDQVRSFAKSMLTAMLSEQLYHLQGKESFAVNTLLHKTPSLFNLTWPSDLSSFLLDYRGHKEVFNRDAMRPSRRAIRFNSTKSPLHDLLARYVDWDAAAPARGTGICRGFVIERNVDRFFRIGDFQGSHVLTADGPADCCDACAYDALCVGFVTVQGSFCALKRSIGALPGAPQSQLTIGLFSGWKACGGLGNREGWGGVPLRGENASECLESPFALATLPQYNFSSQLERPKPLSVPRFAGIAEPPAGCAAPADWSPRGKKALIYLETASPGWVLRARAGGPGGEVVLQESLLWGLRELGVVVVTAMYEADYAAATAAGPPGGGEWDLLFLDEWRLLEGGGGPKNAPLYLKFFNVSTAAGSDHVRAGGVGVSATSRAAAQRRAARRVFVPSFFGSVGRRHSIRAAGVLPRHVLTPFPSNNVNTFLGLRIRPEAELPPDPKPSPAPKRAAASAAAIGQGRRQQGVIWGKEPKYYSMRTTLLKALLELNVTLVSTVSDDPSMKGGGAFQKIRKQLGPRAAEEEGRLVHAGHLTPRRWRRLLRESAFLLGLGDPLAGPSALEALAEGAMYINPVYRSPITFLSTTWDSQHPYLQHATGWLASRPSTDVNSTLSSNVLDGSMTTMRGGGHLMQAGKVCNVLLSDIDAVKACVQSAITDAEQRGLQGGGRGVYVDSVTEARDPEAGLPSEMSGAALLQRLEAALRQSAVPAHCD